MRDVSVSASDEVAEAGYPDVSLIWRLGDEVERRIVITVQDSERVLLLVQRLQVLILQRFRALATLNFFNLIYLNWNVQKT